MPANGRVAPITANQPSPTVTKFGKAAQDKSTRSNDSQVVALKFSPIQSNEIDQLKRTHRPNSIKSNGAHFAVQMSTGRDHRKMQPKLIPWWKSSIIKLIGSFLVGIVCLSIVAVAVMIRTDSSREQTNSSTMVSTNQVIKRSAAPENATPSGVSGQADNHFNLESDKVSQQLLNSDANGWLTILSHTVPVPIKVVIDPQLIKKGPFQPVNPDEQSSNVDIKQSPVEERDTLQMKAAIQSEKSHANPSDQFVIEMDIKVKKNS